jgi:hypothetical protein
MTTIEMLYLGGVLIAFAIFAINLACVVSGYARDRDTAQPSAGED